MSDLPTRNSENAYFGKDGSAAILHAFHRGDLMTRQEFIDSLEVLDTTKVERKSVGSVWFSVDPIYLTDELRDEFRVAVLDAVASGEDTT